MISSLLLVNIVMYDGQDAYVKEICIDANYQSNVGYSIKPYVKKRVQKFVDSYGMELLKIDCNTYHTVSIDDIMSWNDKNSDNDTVEIKRIFVDMFKDKISHFYSDDDYMK